MSPSTSRSDNDVGNFGPSGAPSTASKVMDGPRREERTSAGTGTGGGSSPSNRLTRSSLSAARRGVLRREAQWGMTRWGTKVLVTVVPSADQVNLALPKASDQPPAGSAWSAATS